MTYKGAAAVEMAVKSAASASSLDTGRAVSSFYFHRLLCRVFAGNNKKFVLKGGQAMADKFLCLENGVYLREGSLKSYLLIQGCLQG